MELLGYIAAVLMGLSLGLIGGGGSILTVPILVYFFGEEPLLATTHSLLIVGSTALIGALISSRKKLVDFKTGIQFAVPSFVGVYVTRHFLLPAIPNVVVTLGSLQVTKAILVMTAFAALMVFSSRAMIQAGRAGAQSGAGKGAGKEPGAAAAPGHFNFGILWKGLFVGCMTGFIGAGGGFLIIPALVILLRLPMRLAIGTSLAIIAANSLFGFFITDRAAGQDWTRLLLIAALGVGGLLAGQKMSAGIDEARLKRGFGYFVLAVGAMILFDQIRHMA